MVAKLEKTQRTISQKLSSITTPHMIGAKVSEYDQEIPRSHTAYRPTAPRERATDHR